MGVNSRWMVLPLCFVLITACQTVQTRPSARGPGSAVETWAPFEQDGLWGFKSGDGQTVIPARFRTVTEFTRHGLAATLDGQGWVLINSKGEEVIRPYMFDNGPDYFVDGLARFVRDGKFGFFDERGRVVIQPQFDFAYPFRQGKARVGWGCALIQDGEHQKILGGQWKEIDKTGRVLPD